jgi:YbgC/YbaW family acyl-CoA thioester hydrolase
MDARDAGDGGEASRPPELPVCEYRLTRRVQFHETDLAGVVHFSRYFLYMEEAEHALWRAAGLSIHPRDADIGWPRVHASFDYQRALRFEDVLEVWIRIAAIEERSISYTCRLSRDGAPVATGRMTVACASRRPDEPWRATAVPPEIRARLAVAPAEAAPPGASADREWPRG